MFAPEAHRIILQIQDPCPDPTTALSIVTQKVGTRTHFTLLCTFKLKTEDFLFLRITAAQAKTRLVYFKWIHTCKLVLFRGSNRAGDYAKMGKELTNIFLFVCFSFSPSPGLFADEWVTVEGRFRCVSLTCMSSSCPRSPLGLSPSAHLADGTGDLILVWNTNPLGFLKYLYRHTSAQDQVGACGTFVTYLQ